MEKSKTEPATDKALESRKRFLEIHGVRTTAEAWERELIARIEQETRAAALSRELRLAAEEDLEAETARADEMGRMVTLTERNLVARSNRIAELEETLRDLHDNPPDLAARQSARIAALEQERDEQKARADDCLRELEQETKRHDEAEDIQQKRIAELEREVLSSGDPRVAAAQRLLNRSVAIQTEQAKRIAELEGELVTLTSSNADLEDRVADLTVRLLDARIEVETARADEALADKNYIATKAVEAAERIAELERQLADAKALLSRTLNARASHLTALHDAIEAYLAAEEKA